MTAERQNNLSGGGGDSPEHQRRLAQLKAERDFSKRIIAGTPAIVCGIAPDGVTTFINPAGERLTGWSSEELVGKNWWKTFYPGEAYRQVERLFRDFEIADVRDYEMTLTTKSGEQRTIAWNSINHYDEEGHLIEVVGFGHDITARKQMEEELSRQLMFQRALLDTMPCPVFYKDREGRYLGCNTAMERFLGRSADEIIGRTVFDMAPPDIARKYHAMDEELLAGGGTQEYEWKVPDSEGRVRDVVFQKATFTDANGDVAGLIGVILDITERKQNEEALRDQRALLEIVFDTSPNCVFVKDAEGRYRMANRTVAEMFGTTPEEMIGKTDRDLARGRRIAAGDAERFSDEDMTVIREGKPLHIALDPVTLLDGSVRWFQTVKAPIRLPDDAHCLLGIAVDITDRKRAEERLRESEQRYRLLADNTLDVIWKMNMSMVFDYMNPAIERLTGMSPEQWVGTSLQEHTDEENYRKAVTAVREGIEALPEIRGLAVEIDILDRDGDPVPIEVIGRLVLDDDGRPTAILGVSRDISERRRLEEQLRHSQKIKAVGQLAGGVAHDFNNVLTGIKGYVALALDELDDSSTVHQDLTTVQQLADRAANLTRQLLAFSRQQAMQPVVLDLNALLQDQVKMLQRLIGEHIEMEFDPAADLGRVRADATQLMQVIVNLAVNARDAMPDGGRLTIETRNVALSEEDAGQYPDMEPGDYALIVVSDTGEGMDEETQGRIFEPFFTTREQGQGTGLGLSTAYGIVKQHHGDIRVVSEPGRGATFRIYLPRVSEEAEERAAEPGPPARGSERILLVEDEETVRDIIRRTLEGIGYIVLLAANPAEAKSVAEAQTKPVDLLLTDVVMPGGNGRELYETLAETQPDLKVLFMSGYSEGAIVHHGVLDEDIAFIQKPFDSQTLAARVRRTLDA